MTAIDNTERPANGHAAPHVTPVESNDVIEASPFQDTGSHAELVPTTTSDIDTLSGPDIPGSRDARVDLGWPFVGVIMVITAAIAAVLLLA